MTRQSLNRQGLWPNVSDVIFDVEGTLVDAVPLTLRCWQETLMEPHRGSATPARATPDTP